MGQLWVQYINLGAIPRKVSCFLEVFELAPSLWQQLDP